MRKLVNNPETCKKNFHNTLVFQFILAFLWGKAYKKNWSGLDRRTFKNGCCQLVPKNESPPTSLSPSRGGIGIAYFLASLNTIHNLNDVGWWRRMCDE